MHESNLAESVMPGRLVAGPWTLNLGAGVRIAPRQPVWKLEQTRKFTEEKFEEW
jgi:hypothetical protein